MKPIRILHMIGSLNSGGSQAFVMNIYRNIDRNKVQFDFVIDRANDTFYVKEIEDLGGKVYTLKNIKECNPITFCKQWDSFFENHSEYKIIHGHVRSIAAIYLSIAKKHGLITIAHSHSTASRGNKIEQVVKNIMQLPIKYTADYLFACSNEAGKWLFGEKAIKKDNYKVVKNAIDIEKYVFNESKRNEIRKVLGVEGKFVIGHVGTFTYPKNHKFLIDVFYQVQMQNKNAVLLLVGDGELRPQIEKQIADLRIKDKVILTGVVPNVNDYMQAMDVFVFPSIFEGLGIAVIEAQASGLSGIVADTIPKEAYITDLIKTISLKESADIWVKIILKYSNGYERRNTYKEIKNSGYNISDAAKWLEEFYLRGCEF